MFAILYMIFFIFLFKITIKLWKQFHRKDFVWDTNNGRYWAVVTGSSDGIGFEFARQLALKGYNLLMISRTEQKLEDKKQLILNECQNKIQVKTLAIDFKHTNIYGEISRFLNGHDIFILVNNVGFWGGHVKMFFEEDTTLHNDIVNVNLISVVQMTELCLPEMIQKKRGLILNVSSMTSIHTIPGLSMYGATKAFVTSLTRSLFTECKSHNVLVFNLIPGHINTNFLTVKSSTAPSAQRYVESALKNINWNTGESYGYIFHAIQSYLMKFVEFIIDREPLSGFTMNIVLFFENTKIVDLTPNNIFKFIKYLCSSQPKTD